MWEGILLLVLVVFFMYMWNTRAGVEAKPGCNTCPGKKNVDAI
jgi:hypothetical protein